MRVSRPAFQAVAVFVLLPILIGACAAQTESILYSFTDIGSDGAYPVAGLVFDGLGNLYGTTTSGGNNGGTIFQLTPPGHSWRRVDQEDHLQFRRQP